ncbi:MAG: VUT family protein, partial [Planctomycetota bacterium]
MPTEVLAFVSFIFLTGLVVGAAFFGRGPLGTLSVAYVLLANLTILVEAPMYGGTIAWAIIIYSATHLILNVVAEKHGIGAAVRIAIMNLCAQCLLWVYLWLFIPQNQIVNDETASIYGSLVTLFQSSTIVTIAALVGSVGWFANIFVYAFLKKLAENKGGIHIAARNIVSVAVGQVLNTVIFF